MRKHLAIAAAAGDAAPIGGALEAGSAGADSDDGDDKDNGSATAASSRPAERPKAQPIATKGLWSLKLGMFQGAEPEDLYFTAGINGENNGLIARLSGLRSRSPRRPHRSDLRQVCARGPRSSLPFGRAL